MKRLSIGSTSASGCFLRLRSKYLPQRALPASLSLRDQVSHPDQPSVTEHGDEFSVSLKYGEYLDWLRNCQLPSHGAVTT